ncbi:hypothetical protein GCM10007216_03930 [Thalassobacillus devorans]|uniref:DNA phosphorothioation-dependent restriction protein DptG n=1 Tax=Thalassobacillus devorans TaxID=279813 RepID=A0ABQ1NGK6_9BACI|nr:DNA phosphorothioation-dependent restriction protein DptG [Thalassobacillus devorans]NIK27301.1 DNA phosphorothioation-dependent restriction protein DptG [Thalassobacillus devorans]GGC76579.1 hypothetical protein GCM10007216_03930 [Thalassobacillus devorans]
MSGYFNFQEIESRLSKKKNENGLSSHEHGKVKYAFPFTSHRTKVINEGVNEIIGELVRIMNNVSKPEFKYKGDYTYSDYTLINNVIEKVSFPDEEHHDILADFLEDYLFKNNKELKPLHLYLFNYIETTNKNKNEKEKFARFIFDLFFYQKTELTSLFSSKETDNLLTELIINGLPELETQPIKNQIRHTRYSNVLPFISDIFFKDFLFLSKQKEYFITHFFKIIHYYMFQYVLQFLKSAQKFGNEKDVDEMDPFHFTLDWETGVGGYREAVHDYQFIKTNAINLFVHFHAMSHLSHNHELHNPSDELKSYSKIIQELEKLNPEETQKEKEKLRNWIMTYSNLINTDVPPELKNELEFKELFKVLFNQLQIGMSNDVRKNFGEHIDRLGKGRFLKGRGKHGYLLSLKQDEFLMLSAVAVGDKKIPLKTFFKELKRRGILFDHYSKREAVKLLEQQNYIEKKSDSGDAQYVKPIL